MRPCSSVVKGAEEIREFCGSPHISSTNIEKLTHSWKSDLLLLCVAK